MPRKTTGKGKSADRGSKSLTITPGTRFWLTVIDATYEGPEEDAPKPMIMWVEVHSLDKRLDPLRGEEAAVIAKLLLDPNNPGRVTFRVSAGTEYKQFLDIKIKAEYAQDALGKVQGTGPYYTDVPKPSVPEIPPYRHPREI